MKKNRWLPIALLLLVAGRAWAETPVIDAAQMKAVDPRGAVELRALLPKGDLLMLVHSKPGTRPHFVILDGSRQVVRTIELPFTPVTRVQVNDSGTLALLYDERAHKLWSVDLGSGKSVLLSHGGFGLYSENRSQMFGLGDDFAAWGYFLNDKHEFVGDYLVHIDGRTPGEPRKVMKWKDLAALSRQTLPGTTALRYTAVHGDYLACVGTAGQAVTGLMVLKTGQPGVVYSEPARESAGLALQGHWLAAVLAADAGPPQLILVDLATGRRQILGKGLYLYPIFSQDGKKVAALIAEKVPDKTVKQTVAIFSTDAPDKPEIIPLKDAKLFLDLRFMADDTLRLFDGTTVYKAP